MEDHGAFEEFIDGLFDLYSNKTHVARAYEDQTWLVLLLAWYYKETNQIERAVKMIQYQQENQFHLMNSPAPFKLLIQIDPKSTKALFYAEKCLEHNTNH